MGMEFVTGMPVVGLMGLTGGRSHVVPVLIINNYIGINLSRRDQKGNKCPHYSYVGVNL